MTELPNDLRDQVLDDFSKVTGLPTIRRFTQRGTDRATALFALELDTGRTITIGSIDTLASQSELNKTMLVAIGQGLTRSKISDWEIALGQVFRHGLDIETIDGTGGSLADNVNEWLDRYTTTTRVHTERNEACAQRAPYNADDQLHLHADTFYRYITRDLGQDLKITSLHSALVDLGFTRRTINYTSPTSKKRSTVSYYARPTDNAPPPAPGTPPEPDDPQARLDDIPTNGYHPAADGPDTSPGEPPAPRARSPQDVDQPTANHG